MTSCGLVICITTVSEEPAACIFSVEDEECSRFLQNDSNHLTNYQSTKDHKLKEDKSLYCWL